MPGRHASKVKNWWRRLSVLWVWQRGSWEKTPTSSWRSLEELKVWEAPDIWTLVVAQGAVLHGGGSGWCPGWPKDSPPPTCWIPNTRDAPVLQWNIPAKNAWHKTRLHPPPLKKDNPHVWGGIFLINSNTTHMHQNIHRSFLHVSFLTFKIKGNVIKHNKPHDLPTRRPGPEPEQMDAAVSSPISWSQKKTS